MRSVAVFFYVLFVVASVMVVIPQSESESCDLGLSEVELGLSEDELALAQRFDLTTCNKFWNERGFWQGPGDCADDPEEAC